MPTYQADGIPDEVGRGTLDPELAEFLKTVPRLGAHEPIHVQRASHDALVPKHPPPIGRVEHLGLPGPHGTVPVRCYHPSRPGPARGAALVYLHGGGWTVGTLDQFETPMRLSNAGLQRDATLDDMTLEQWNTVIAVNLTGQFLCGRAASREFKRRGVDAGVSVAAGKIVCMSSVHQQIAWAGHVNYASSKGGIMMMMQSMAQELAPFRVRVNAIAPGAIRTPINTSAWNTPEAYKALMTLVPYKRIGEPDDIARAAVWLASDASDYVTGTTLFVDGGMTLYPGFATGG